MKTLLSVIVAARLLAVRAKQTVRWGKLQNE